jgi:UDP-glucose 4-epimerase
MNIFITGATGFIGSHVLEIFSRSEHKIAYLVRPSSDIWRIKHLQNTPHFLPIEGSMDDVEALKPSLSSFNPNIFIHLAWNGINAKARQDISQFENYKQSLALYNLGKELNISHFIGLGSQAEYGLCANIIAENQPTLPNVNYGYAKLATFETLKNLAATDNIRFSWLRLFSAYGPKDGPEWLIPYITLSLLKGEIPKLTACEQVWDYIHASDCATAIQALALSDTAQGLFNLGSGTAQPLQQIVETIYNEIMPGTAAEMGQVPYRDGQVMHLEADITKLKSATNWKPQKSINEGIIETARWYKENAARFQ